MLLLVLLTVCLVTGCGNRYVKNYSGERYSKTKRCDLVNAELQYYAIGKSFEQQLDEYKQQGYNVVGMGENDIVVKCRNTGMVSYAPAGSGIAIGGGQSQCTGTKLDKKNQKKLSKACRAVGAKIALYDSQKILYLR